MRRYAKVDEQYWFPISAQCSSRQSLFRLRGLRVVLREILPLAASAPICADAM